MKIDGPDAMDLFDLQAVYSDPMWSAYMPIVYRTARTMCELTGVDPDGPSPADGHVLNEIGYGQPPAALRPPVAQHRRLLQLWTGDEDCLHGYCGHPRPAGGVCEGLQPADRLCTACSAIIDSGSEFGPWFAVRVAWPCTVIDTVATQYQVPPPAGPALSETAQ